jgi:hypothetical protein
MTAPHSQTRSDNASHRIDLNPLHTAAAALGAVTAAIIGSLLRAAETLIGAAGANVVTSIGTALYQVSLERSREKVRALTLRTRASQSSGDGPETAYHPMKSSSLADLSRSGQPPSSQRLMDGADYERQSRTRARSFSPRWVAVVAGAAVAFVDGDGTTIAERRDINTPSDPAPSTQCRKVIANSSLTRASAFTPAPPAPHANLPLKPLR